MEPHFIAKKLPKLPRPDPRFLCGRNTIIAFELVMLIAGIGPYDKQWFGDHPKCADGRMKMMRDFAQGITRNLFRDIDDRIIRPLVLGADEITDERDRSRDAIDITEADTFARRLGSPHWAVLWGRREADAAEAPGKSANELPAVRKNRPGRKPTRRLEVEGKMLADIQVGSTTIEGLAGEKEISLALGYNTSRYTARRARINVLNRIPT
jgi:hypothetical protein